MTSGTIDPIELDTLLALEAAGITPVTYHGSHSRVRRARGPARDHLCACGAQAHQWSFRPDARFTLTGTTSVTKKGRVYWPRVSWSPDAADYDALCAACHRARDYDRDAHIERARAAWSAPGRRPYPATITPAQVTLLNKLMLTSQRTIADVFATSPQSVRRAIRQAKKVVR